MEIPRHFDASVKRSAAEWRAGGAATLEPSPVLSNYIGGAFVRAADSGTLDDIDPSTGDVLCTLPRSLAVDVDAAVEAASAAFGAWSRSAASARADALDRIADGLEAWLPELAAMESADSGKTLKMASAVDIPRAVANFRFFAGALRHDETGCYAMHDALNYVLRVPVGVCGLISPWNLPLYLASWKIAPALACGNCVVLKPSEVTPRTASALARIIHAAGLPAGVFNLVHGLGGEAGQALCAHPRVPLISFTGGTETGRRVALTCAPLFKKLSLELGGKNSTVVFPDADLALAVPGAVRAAFTNNGQVCLAGSRIFVHTEIFGSFLPAFITAVKALRLGAPASPETDVGPVSSAAHADKVRRYIAQAEAEGGTIMCGGSAAPALAPTLARGFFIAPTVIASLPHTSAVSTEEIFGPVACVHSFESEEEVVAAVNGTRYGLAVSVWTRDLGRASRCARAIETGLIWINTWLHRDLRTPFGGVKDSGLGREGGKYSLDFYSEARNVCVFTGAPPPAPA